MVFASPEQSTGTSRRVHTGGIALLLLVSVLWSLSGLSVKYVQLHPVAFAFYRSLAAAAAIGLLSLGSRGCLPPAGWTILGIVVHAVVVTSLVASMTLATAATGILLQYTAPIFCALIAWRFQGRRITAPTIVAMIVAAGGIAIMLAGHPPAKGMAGPMLGLISGAAFGALILILEKQMKLVGGQVSVLRVTALNNLGTAILLLPMLLWFHEWSIPPGKLGIVAATGVIQLALPYILFQHALKRVHPVEASLLTLLEPVLNPVWVALAGFEQPSACVIVGGVAILTAMAIEIAKPPPRDALSPIP